LILLIYFQNLAVISGFGLKSWAKTRTWRNFVDSARIHLALEQNKIPPVAAALPCIRRIRWKKGADKQTKSREADANSCFQSTDASAL
jgi:hypothetical protein